MAYQRVSVGPTMLPGWTLLLVMVVGLFLAVLVGDQVLDMASAATLPANT